MASTALNPTDGEAWSMLVRTLSSSRLPAVPQNAHKIRIDPWVQPDLDRVHHEVAAKYNDLFIERPSASSPYGKLKSYIETEFWGILEHTYSLEAYGGCTDGDWQRSLALACEHLYRQASRRLLEVARDNKEDDDGNDPMSILERAFARNPFPTASERAILSQSTGLDYKRFQNRRNRKPRAYYRDKQMQQSEQASSSPERTGSAGGVERIITPAPGPSQALTPSSSRPIAKMPSRGRSRRAPSTALADSSPLPHGALPLVKEAATPDSAINESSGSRPDAHYDIYEPLGISLPQQHHGSFSRSSSYSSAGPQTPESQPALPEAYFNTLEGGSVLASAYASQAAELQAFSLFDFSLDDLGAFGQALGGKGDFAEKVTDTVETADYSHSHMLEGTSGHVAGGAPSVEVSQEGLGEHIPDAHHARAIDRQGTSDEAVGYTPDSDDTTEGFLVDLNWLFSDSGHEDSVDEDMDYTDAATPFPADAALTQSEQHLQDNIQLLRCPSSASLPSLVAGTSRSVSSSSAGSSMLSIPEGFTNDDQAMEIGQKDEIEGHLTWDNTDMGGRDKGERVHEEDSWNLRVLFV